MTYHSTFAQAIESVQRQLITHSHDIHTDFWQAVNISNRPEAAMKELIYVEFRVPLPVITLQYYRDDIKPNLPWADDHFEKERISGEPLNPGTTWKDWPYGLAADKHRTEGEQFSHSYAERYWPRYAGLTPGGELWEHATNFKPNTGTRYGLGDLSDVISLLERDPLTRQAYLPVWFPEDTGAVYNQRVPCTLGYHFMRRGNNFHVYYPIRSCDFVRHFRDDLYLTVRLTLHILNQLKERDAKNWKDIVPGMFMFWAGSMHCFVSDHARLKKEKKESLK